MIGSIELTNGRLIDVVASNDSQVTEVKVNLVPYLSEQLLYFDRQVSKVARI